MLPTLRGADIAVQAFRVEDGYLTVPTSPRLGIGLRKGALARSAYREFSPRAIPTPRDEGS